MFLLTKKCISQPNPMLIYFIDPQSYSNLSVYDHSLLKGMEGHDIVYFNSVKYDYEELPGVEMRSVFRYNDMKNSLAKLLSYSASMMKVAGYACKERPDVIHIQWFRAWLVDYLLVFFFHLLGIKIVYTAHNILPHNHHFWDSFIFTRFYRAVDAIIVHSERTKNEMRQMLGIGENKISVIHHGILPSSYDADSNSQEINRLRHKLGIGEDALVFACLGIQNKYKGVDLVVDVWSKSELLRKGNCHLLFVGKNDGIDFSPVADMPNVHIVSDRVSNAEFDAYLRLSSVVLLPYINISQSGVLFTAIQAGVPVLVSDVGGLAEPLGYAKVGWCMGVPSVENLQKEMEFLLLNTSEVIDVRNDTDAFMRTCKAYDWGAISKRTEELYLAQLKRN